MNKKYYNWSDVETAANSILLQLYKDNWKPDYIVGLTRGGLPLAVILSNRLSIPMHALGVSLRDTDIGPESNCWMAEDAYNGMNILIVDDINDTGATFKWIKEDWSLSAYRNDPKWNEIWDHTVRFTVMTQNWSSEFDQARYWWDEVNKADNDVWLVYPWEREAWLKGSDV